MSLIYENCELCRGCGHQWDYVSDERSEEKCPLCAMRSRMEREREKRKRALLHARDASQTIRDFLNSILPGAVNKHLRDIQKIADLKTELERVKAELAAVVAERDRWHEASDSYRGWMLLDKRHAETGWQKYENASEQLDAARKWAQAWKSLAKILWSWLSPAAAFVHSLNEDEPTLKDGLRIIRQQRIEKRSEEKKASSK